MKSILHSLLCTLFVIAVAVGAAPIARAGDFDIRVFGPAGNVIQPAEKLSLTAYDTGGGNLTLNSYTGVYDSTTTPANFHFTFSLTNNNPTDQSVRFKITRTNGFIQIPGIYPNTPGGVTNYMDVILPSTNTLVAEALTPDVFYENAPTFREGRRGLLRCRQRCRSCDIPSPCTKSASLVRSMERDRDYGNGSFTVTAYTLTGKLIQNDVMTLSVTDPNQSTNLLGTSPAFNSLTGQFAPFSVPTGHPTVWLTINRSTLRPVIIPLSPPNSSPSSGLKGNSPRPAYFTVLIGS